MRGVGCPLPPHPPLRVVSGGRRRPPSAAAVGHDMDLVGWFVKGKKPEGQQKTCPHRHPLEVGSCGCGQLPQPPPPDPLTTHPLLAEAAAVWRHTWRSPPASSPSQFGQRRPPWGARSGRIFPPHHRLNVDSGGRHRAQNAVAFSLPTTRSMSTAAATIGRHTWLPAIPPFATQSR